jgi:RNA polymerase sigma-70 factor (ECF subfamily)
MTKGAAAEDWYGSFAIAGECEMPRRMRGHSGGAPLFRVATLTFEMAAVLAPCPGTTAPTVHSIYEAHATFVALTLHRLGVQPIDVEDLAHEVFLVVHRRFGSFDGSSRVTTWLFGICRRVAANYRRGRERTSPGGHRDAALEPESIQIPPDELLTREEDLAVAHQILSRLDGVYRHVFVMFVLETRSCPEIAQIMNVPVGTVYSRLHGARRQIGKIARTLRPADARAPVSEALPLVRSG